MNDYSSDVELIKNSRSLDEIASIAKRYSAKATKDGGILYSGRIGEVSSGTLSV
ncbi:hypothetical protein PD5205_03554 [Xanthomonas fragariae]|uniref:Uncharacterized protein n=2 Tax=Xanthomonas fragariae TaxID=48664 RepID=A0A1Y6H2H3_9XANT|nr:hypothetical protein PD885_00440 [Xanthomonas fragariae]SMR04829.1 hypothetical protein PD5205_03554 [Xanthomonas fragariae]